MSLSLVLATHSASPPRTSGLDWPTVIGLAIGLAAIVVAGFIGHRTIKAGNEATEATIKAGNEATRKTVERLDQISKRIEGSTGQLMNIGERVEAVATHVDSTAGSMVTITEGIGSVAGQMHATLDEVRRSRIEDRLLRELERFERINAGVQTIMLVTKTTQDLMEQVSLIRTAQAGMRAALAAIPGADGSVNSPVRECVILARGNVYLLPSDHVLAAALNDDETAPFGDDETAPLGGVGLTSRV